jgi:hypothetical protein
MVAAAAAGRVSWTENTDSKGANDIEAHMLQDNIFFTSFVWYSATINMESNITYMVQGTSKSVVPSSHPPSTKVDFFLFIFGRFCCFLLKYHPRGRFLSI